VVQPLVLLVGPLRYQPTIPLSQNRKNIVTENLCFTTVNQKDKIAVGLENKQQSDPIIFFWTEVQPMQQIDKENAQTCCRVNIK